MASYNTPRLIMDHALRARLWTYDLVASTDDRAQATLRKLMSDVRLTSDELFLIRDTCVMSCGVFFSRAIPHDEALRAAISAGVFATTLSYNHDDSHRDSTTQVLEVMTLGGLQLGGDYQTIALDVLNALAASPATCEGSSPVVWSVVNRCRALLAGKLIMQVLSTISHNKSQEEVSLERRHHFTPSARNEYDYSGRESYVGRRLVDVFDAMTNDLSAELEREVRW